MTVTLLATALIAILWEVLLTRRTMYIVAGKRARAALASGAIELVSLVPVLFLLHAKTIEEQIAVGIVTAAACIVGNYLATWRQRGNP